MALIERPEVDPDVAEFRRALGNAKLVEHAIEAQAWTLVSYQSASTVNLELARAEYDTAFGLDTADPTREPTLVEIRQRIANAFVTRLAEAVESAPDDGVPLR